MSKKPDLYLDLRDLLDNSNATGDLTCVVRDPNGQNIDAAIEMTAARKRDIKFFPKLTGKYNVYLYYDKELIPGSPYVIEVLQKPTA